MSIINTTCIKQCFIALALLIPFFSTAQQELQVESMTFKYSCYEDSIFCFVTAPTKGWIMVGFNDKNSLIGADFKFFSVHEGKAINSDQKNKGGRNYFPDNELEGSNDIHLLYGTETKEKTSISFSIPLRNNDHNDYQHKTKAPFWLILAYSVDDDFQHHSIFRKHLPFQWEP